MRAALAVAVLTACSSPAREPKYGVPTPTPCDPTAAPLTDVFRDLVAPDAAACKAPPNATISRADALADLDAVERVLRRGYVAFELMAMRGASWDRMLHEMRDAIGSMKEPIATDMFGVWLADRLSVTGDHTITVTSYDKAGAPHVESAGARDTAYALDVTIDLRNRVVTAADPALVGKRLDCASTVERKAASITPEKATWRLLALEPRAPASTTCKVHDDNANTDTTVTLPFHRVATGGRDTGPALQQRGTSVPILRVRSLDEDNNLQELAQLSNIGAQLFQQPALVLDLRNLQPGSYDFRAFFDGLLPVMPSTETQSLYSEVIAQSDVNVAQCSPSEDSDVAAERGYLDKLAKAGYGERGWRRGRTASAPRTGGRGPSRPYPGVFVMVVDEKCADACEDAVRMMRLLPRTVLVGENTAGKGEVDRARPYRLPRSRLWFTAGTELHPGVTIEGTGHLPDLWLDGDKPDDAIDAIARCAADAACARDIVTTR